MFIFLGPLEDLSAWGQLLLSFHQVFLYLSSKLFSESLKYFTFASKLFSQNFLKYYTFSPQIIFTESLENSTFLLTDCFTEHFLMNVTSYSL